MSMKHVFRSHFARVFDEKSWRAGLVSEKNAISYDGPRLSENIFWSACGKFIDRREVVSNAPRCAYCERHLSISGNEHRHWVDVETVSVTIETEVEK